MSGVHKYPTISFRISPSERKEIEAKILASGMRKKDYFIRSCIYNRVCVVGKKETIYPLVEQLKVMQEKMELLATELSQNKTGTVAENISEIQEEYEDMLKAILWMLDGAKYLWQSTENTKEKSPDSGNC